MGPVIMTWLGGMAFIGGLAYGMTEVLTARAGRNRGIFLVGGAVGGS